jgi:peptidoglycan hydrolase-like protein with peptidoglycan-binding domain
VRNLQNDLNEWRAQNGRPPIDVNGRFTNNTKEAVQDFQRANGLKDDGIVGIRTRTRLALENNANFRQLNDATKTQVREQMTRYDGDATKLQNLSQLATSDGFRQLNVDHQRQMLTALDGRASDRKFGGELTALANSATFRGLNDAEKTQMINNISTHRSAAAFVGSLNNDQLLALAESPSGPNQLAALREAMQSGGVDRAERAQLERIASATFTPGVGLNVNGSAADQATYLHMVRREMLTSPTFRNLMNTQNADRAHPLTINVGRNQGGVQIDRFRDETIDLTDYEQFPETPPAGNPDATTRGQNLVHFMAEARQGVLGNNFDRSHARGIQAENQYRAEIGQRSRLTSSPFDAAGNIEMRYSNGYRETIQFGGTDGVTGIDRRNP